MKAESTVILCEQDTDTSFKDRTTSQEEKTFYALLILFNRMWSISNRVAVIFTGCDSFMTE